MLLTTSDAELFFRLHRSFMFFVNDQLQIIPGIETPGEFSGLPPEARLSVRNAYLEKPELLDSFLTANPFDFPENELAVVASWRHQVVGKFYIFRELKNYMVFLSMTDPAIAYGVLALSQPFEELVGPYLPILVETALLPFRDKIVYDGLMNGYNISFGPGIRRSLNESFKEAKARQGIVTALPMNDHPRVPAKLLKAKSRPKAQPSKTEDSEEVQVIFSMVDQFCRDHLSEEYAVLCHKLAEKLARKRPSPLLSGKPNTWACGIVRTIGWVNFLDDRSQSPHMKLTAIDKIFGVGESTGQGKSMLIRRLLKIRQFDHHWTLPSRMDDNPMIWQLEVNGFIRDIRRCPREAQEIAFEKGLIPYIPADRNGD